MKGASESFWHEVPCGSAAAQETKNDNDVFQGHVRDRTRGEAGPCRGSRQIWDHFSNDPVPLRRNSGRPGRPGARGAKVGCYRALVVELALDLIGPRATQPAEGRFAFAKVFVSAPESLHPGTRSLTARADSDVS
jgi:hypothetical protein